jgi:hypothetical protein
MSGKNNFGVAFQKRQSQLTKLFSVEKIYLVNGQCYKKKTVAKNIPEGEIDDELYKQERKNKK